MKTYKAKRKGLINYLLIGFLLLPLFIFFLNREFFTEYPYVLLPLAGPLLLLLRAYFDTSYRVNNETLEYRSGFLKGKINIVSIREISKGKTLQVGLKPALAPKGLIIKYNRYDKIYFAPEQDEELIADLLKINPKIAITAG